MKTTPSIESHHKEGQKYGMEDTEHNIEKLIHNKTNVDLVFLSTFHYLITLIFCNL